MHGLINRSIQSFVEETYGQPVWYAIMADAQLDFTGFESLMIYDDAVTYRVVDAACASLKKPRESFLEDIGTFLCSHPNLEPVRRLLRFGGETFVDFLWSLDDLSDRARLAVPELTLPMMDIRHHASDRLILRCRGTFNGFGHVMVGVLRAMSDDYGTLAMLEHLGSDGGVEIVSVQLLESGFSAGRVFNLTQGAH